MRAQVKVSPLSQAQFERAKARACVVKSEWLPLAGGRVDAEFWLEVTRRLPDPRAATADDVRAAIGRLHADLASRWEAAASLRDQAAALVERARELEKMPKRLGGSERYEPG